MTPVVDDGSIGNDANLLRRIHPKQIVNDKNNGMCRPSSGAFKDPEMSVDAEPILHAGSLDWRFSLRNDPDYSLVCFVAGVARAENQKVIHDPEPDNKAHSVVVGAKNKGVARALSTASEWVRIGTKGPYANDCEVPAGVATDLE